MAHTICGIDLGAFSVKLALLEVGFRSSILRGLEEIAVPSGDAPLLERQLDAIPRGAVPGLGGGRHPIWRCPATAVGARARAALHRPAQDRPGGRLRARGADRAPASRTWSSITWWSATGAEGSTVLAVAAKRDEVGSFIAAAGGAAASIPARSTRRRSSIGRCRRRPRRAADATGRRRRRPCQAVARLRSPAHQRLHRARRAGDQRAHHPPRRLPPDRGDREGVRRRPRSRRAGQAQRGVPGQPAGGPPTSPLAAKLDAVLREALAPHGARAAANAGQLHLAAPASTSASLLITGGGGRLRGLLAFPGSRARHSCPLPRRPPGARPAAGRAVAAPSRVRTPAAAPTSREPRAGAPRWCSPPAAAPGDRLSARRLRLPRQLLDPAPAGLAPGGAGRRGAGGGRRSTWARRWPACAAERKGWTRS